MMGGVDLADQQLETLLFLRKSYKWYKKVALRLLLHCLLNAHKLYQLQGGKNDFLKFIQGCVTTMISRSPKANSNVNGGRIDNTERLVGRNHFPGRRQVEGKDNKSSLTKNCKVCYAQGRRTPKGHPIVTAWICTGCSSEPGLCIDSSCFRDYHTMLDYSKESSYE